MSRIISSNIRKSSIAVKGIIFRERLFQDRKGGPGGRLNKKDGLTRYGDSHVKDKTS